MIRSMTGYGAAEVEHDGQRLGAEIRSVNHRYCEVSIRAPRVVTLFEDRIRSLVQNRFSRGKFSLSLTWSGVGEKGEVLKLNESVADRYVDLLQQIRDRYKLASGLDVRTLAMLPDLFSWEHDALSDDETWGLVEKVVAATCDNMEAMKIREGAALARDFKARLDLLRKHLDQVSVRAPLRPQEAKERLMSRIQGLLGDVEMDPIRLAQEVAILSDKLDCTEECVRLAAHIDQFRSLIDGPEAAGRKLNFLLQEMNREANTISSKSNDVEMTRSAIAMKEEVERLREQVQNVE